MWDITIFGFLCGKLRAANLLRQQKGHQRVSFFVAVKQERFELESRVSAGVTRRTAPAVREGADRERVL